MHTSYGGFIDLLAINSEGELIIIELKRSKTPRDIVAQCLDYGTWVHNLNRDEIVDIYNSYKSSDLEKDFSDYFDTPVPDKMKNCGAELRSIFVL